MELKDKVAVIVGATGKIGNAIATEFKNQGAKVICAGRNIDKLIKSKRDFDYVSYSDICDSNSIDSLVATVMNKNGKIDILVNATGTYGVIGFADTTKTVNWTSAVKVNLIGTYHLLSAIIPHMKIQQSGKIILFAGGGNAPLPGFSAYIASKFGMIGLMMTVAEEVKNFNIQINAISPGLINSDMQDDVLCAGFGAGDLYYKIKKLKETGEGEADIKLTTNLAVFLASDKSKNLTGKVISAVHDDWKNWNLDEINKSIGYTFGRIDPYNIENYLKNSGH